MRCDAKARKEPYSSGFRVHTYLIFTKNIFSYVQYLLLTYYC